MRAYIHVSWLDPCKVRRITIVGSEKMVVYNDLAGDQKIRIYDVGIEEDAIVDPVYGEPVKYRLGDIVSPRLTPQEPLACRRRTCSTASARGGAAHRRAAAVSRSARVLEAANDALHSGREVLARPRRRVIDITIDSIPAFTPLAGPVVLDQQATA